MYEPDRDLYDKGRWCSSGEKNQYKMKVPCSHFNHHRPKYLNLKSLEFCEMLESTKYCNGMQGIPHEKNWANLDEWRRIFPVVFTSCAMLCVCEQGQGEYPGIICFTYLLYARYTKQTVSCPFISHTVNDSQSQRIASTFNSFFFVCQ